ncbi:hypothetical protein SmJEL517_g03174 [Synchytrium microbalum]|uniref:Uncharacterized protein n=1 Tax=Synchytrium microbalum TaxID=1806994 RepID=A0A507C2S5_9FUNG|nr:uncharacterized protein SmJEL517_g03174 [Synchytrium microbalum]TPX34032.1 hypothetical protein SmJEL517_g03174 [Synchytrium microbalum]
MAEVAAPGGPAPPPADGGFFGNLFSFQGISRMVMIWMVTNAVVGYFTPKPPPVQQVQTTSETGESILVPKITAYTPAWGHGINLDLYVYLSESEEHPSFSDEKSLIWFQPNILFGNTSEYRRLDTFYTPSEDVKNNGSLYAHMYLTPHGASPNPAAKSYDAEHTLEYSQMVTRYKRMKKVSTKKKLVGVVGYQSKDPEPVVSEQSEEHDEEGAEKKKEELPIISYWWPNISIALVMDQNQYPANLPPHIMKNVKLTPDGFSYYPIFYMNEFWLLHEKLYPINSTTSTLDVALQFYSLSSFYHQMYMQLDDSFKQQSQMMGQSDGEKDEVKRMLLETNPYLMGITMFVSILHSLFDFLAFKNEVQFWQKKKDMEGLSFRTIVWNVATQFIIFLYLMDNETSWMVLISSGVGLLIEMWKINKTVNVKTKATFPFVEFVDKVKASKLVRKTKKYDEIAFRYMSYLLYPCLLGYAIYSLYNEEHKSWYSFIVSTLVGFVYMFGFITMTPQLFINYKLKSVAHMPWKTFMYKALNTFIDDLFAFIVKMPWLHRIACLRDDVVFFVYLYQRWVYPEDSRRRNEFGQVGEDGGGQDDLSDEDEDELEKEDKKEEKKEGGGDVDKKPIDGASSKGDKKSGVKESKKVK